MSVRAPAAHIACHPVRGWADPKRPARNTVAGPAGSIKGAAAHMYNRRGGPCGRPGGHSERSLCRDPIPCIQRQPGVGCFSVAPVSRAWRVIQNA